MLVATSDPVLRGRQELRQVTIVALASIVWPCVWFADETRDVIGYLFGSVALLAVIVPFAIAVVDRRAPLPFRPPVATAISRGTLVAWLIVFFATRYIASALLPTEQLVSSAGDRPLFVDLAPNLGRAYVLAWLAATWTLVAIHLVRENEGHVRFEPRQRLRWRWPLQRSREDRLHSEP